MNPTHLRTRCVESTLVHGVIVKNVYAALVCLSADKPWDCGVCDTPGLWRGAAGLCARVRAWAGAAESLHTYICLEQPVLFKQKKIVSVEGTHNEWRRCL